ncbi:MAG: dihydroorotate dehydrogenase electron transfer subunit [Clostridia bacterium]
MKRTDALLKESICVRHDVFRFILEDPYIAEKAEPGQFVAVRCSDAMDMVLRRPLSIYDTDIGRGEFELVFQVKGEGTRRLSMKKPGETVDVIGPLGTGFRMDERHGKIALVGGGIGIFPLHFLAKRLQGIHVDYYAGFQCADSVILLDEFSEVVDRVFLCSDDGSCGLQGYVTESFRNNCLGEGYDMIYTCGPDVMMGKVAKTAAEAGCLCQVSLEERMGCGIGACLVCACRVRKNGQEEMLHVCKDGPVFYGHEIYGKDGDE